MQVIEGRVEELPARAIGDNQVAIVRRGRYPGSPSIILIGPDQTKPVALTLAPRAAAVIA